MVAIDQFTLQQKALLSLWLRDRALAREPSAGIRRASRDSKLPLSFGQQRLWFLAQLDPADPSYNVPLGLRLEGRFNVHACFDSLNEVIRRHEALRTRFVSSHGIPEQIIDPEARLPATVIDLSGLEYEVRENILSRETEAEAVRPFDLACTPLLRCLLFRLAPQEHVLLLTLHHIAGDAWSLDVLIREIGALYPALMRGDPSPLPPLTIQYVDFAVWQRQRFTGAVLDEQLRYWKTQLEGAATVQLPADRPRPAKASHAGATISLQLDRKLTESCEELCRRHDVTLFVIVLATLDVLLARYSGQDSITVGAPIANRTRAEVEPLIGFFVNTLVLRADLSGNPAFHELLQRLKQVCIGAYEHQEFAFEKLVQELQPERDLSRNPLFQVSLALQNARRERLALPELSLHVLPRQYHAARFDQSWDVSPSPDGLEIAVTYSTAMFNEDTVSRMLAHFAQLLKAAVADPAQRIRHLPMLTDIERRQMGLDWK